MEIRWISYRAYKKRKHAKNEMLPRKVFKQYRLIDHYETSIHARNAVLAVFEATTSNQYRTIRPIATLFRESIPVITYSVVKLEMQQK